MSRKALGIEKTEWVVLQSFSGGNLCEIMGGAGKSYCKAINPSSLKTQCILCKKKSTLLSHKKTNCKTNLKTLRKKKKTEYIIQFIFELILRIWDERNVYQRENSPSISYFKWQLKIEVIVISLWFWFIECYKLFPLLFVNTSQFSRHIYLQIWR